MDPEEVTHTAYYKPNQEQTRSPAVLKERALSSNARGQNKLKMFS